MKNKSIKLVLGIWILLLVLVNLVWLYIDNFPPAWDQAAHLKSMVWFTKWANGSFNGGWWNLMNLFWGYPPLIYIVGGLYGLVFGLNIDGLTFLNTLFFVGAVVGVYKLAEQLSKDEKIAILAVIIFSLFPVLGDISRNMLLDLPLLTWVIWGWYFGIKSNNLMNKKESWMAWLMLVLASLTKLNGFLYFIPVVVILMIKSFKNIDILVKLVVGGLAYFLAVGWWWIGNWSSIYQYLTGLAGQGETLTDPMNLMEWQTWTHYWKLMVLHQIGPIVSFLAIFLGFFLPKKNKNNWLMIFLFLSVYVMFTIIKNKDFRFTLPILPLVAIWIAWGINRLILKSKVVGKIFLVLILGWMAFNFIENGFGWPIKKPIIISTSLPILGDVDWVGFDDYPVRQTQSGKWPNEEILNDLKSFNGSEEIRVLTLVNTEEINDNNLNLYGLLKLGQGQAINSLDIGTEFDSDEQAWGVVEKYNYFLIPEKDYEAAPFYTVNLKSINWIREWFWRNIDSFEILKEYQLPNQKKIFLIKSL